LCIAQPPLDASQLLEGVRQLVSVLSNPESVGGGGGWLRILDDEENKLTPVSQSGCRTSTFDSYYSYYSRVVLPWPKQ